MNKKNFIFTFIFVTVCISTNAQWKQSDAYASGMHNTVVRRKAIDTASLRIKYAWGATDITQDCGQLLIGQRMTKYSSWFVEVADSQRVQWAKMNPHAQSVPNGTWWMRGKKPGVWSEYQYSNIFIHGDTLNEWAVMPMGQEWPQRYEEKWNGQDWTLQGDTASFLGHQCQKAMCHWRGRDYIAWFAPDIPIRRGPWKFGGLPGLIMKVHDVDSLYVFEAVAIENGNFPIWQYPKDEFMKSSRQKTWKLQKAFNLNFSKTAGRRRMNPDGTIGDLISHPHEYDPLELE